MPYEEILMSAIILRFYLCKGESVSFLTPCKSKQAKQKIEDFDVPPSVYLMSASSSRRRLQTCAYPNRSSSGSDRSMGAMKYFSSEAVAG